MPGETDTRSPSVEATGETDTAAGDPQATSEETVVSEVTAALTTVPDPNLGTHVVASAVVTGVDATDGAVTITADLAGLDAETADELTATLRRAAFSVAGVDRVTVASADGTAAAERPRDGGATTESDEGTADGGEKPSVEPDGLTLDGVETVVAVASAKGGVGKTTVATQLARAIDASGADVGLFDADLHGPNVPERLGIEGPVEATDDGRAAPVTHDGIEVMSVGLLASEQPLAWRGAVIHDALTDLLGDTAWTDRDVLVIDLPPGTGDTVLTTLDAVPIDGVVLVTTPDPSAVGDTVRSATLVRENGVPLAGVVANMTAATCPDCGTEHSVFPMTNVGEAFEAPLLAEFPVAEEFRDPAEPADAARELADAVEDRLTEVDRLDPPESALDLRGLPERVAREQVRTEVHATDPTESLWLRSDRDPEPLLSAVARQDSTVAAAEWTVDRQGPESWVARIDREGGATR